MVEPVGPMFAAEIRKRRVSNMRRFPQWRRHLDEVFVKINGKLCYLWRAVDHEGGVLETVVTAKRDKAAALKFLKRIMKKYGRPRSVVTDGLSYYPAAMREIGNDDRHEVGRRLNNWAETRISLFDDESEPCSGSEARRRSRNSAEFMLRFTTISTRNVISSPAKSTNRDARPRSASGARSWPDSRLGLGKLCHIQTTCRYSDNARKRHPRSEQRRR